VEEDSVVVVLVVAVAGTPEAVVVVSTAVAASNQVGSMVAGKSHMELAAAELVSALAECACQMVFRALKALDPASLRLGIHPTHNLRSLALAHNLRARRPQGSWLSAFRALANTSPRSMTRTGTTIGTGAMFTLTMAASLYLSAGFGAD